MVSYPRLTLASGPVDVSAETLRAMQKPVVYHYDPVFLETFRRTSELMAKVFQTNYDIVLLQAEAIAGLEAAAASVIEPGTKVLNLVSGVFGKGFEDWIIKYGGEVIEIAVPYNAAIDPEDVRRAFALNPDISVVSVVHSETPSGTINPIREIGQIAREHGAITIIDTVSGLLSEDFSPEAWGMDIAVAGPQKCLSGVPGMSLISVSPEAWSRMEAMKTPLRGSFLSLLDWKSTWIENGRFPYTPSVSDVYALESVLQQTLDEGVANIVARHQVSARATRAAVRALGLELWAESDDIASSCCTAVSMPGGVDDAVLRNTMRNKYGVMISGGYGSVAGKLFRLGHMGLSAHPTSVIAQLGVLERSLLDVGYKVKLGEGVAAALAEFADWDDETRTYR